MNSHLRLKHGDVDVQYGAAGASTTQTRISNFVGCSQQRTEKISKLIAPIIQDRRPLSEVDAPGFRSHQLRRAFILNPKL